MAQNQYDMSDINPLSNQETSIIWKCSHMSVVVNRPVIHPEDWPYKRLLCVITFGTCYLFSSLTPPRTSNLPGFVTGSLITSAIYGARPVCYWFLHYLDSQQTGPIRTAMHEARLGQAWALATANRFCIKSHHVITAFSFIAEVPVFWVKGWKKEAFFLCTCFIDWPERSVWEPLKVLEDGLNLLTRPLISSWTLFIHCLM